MKNPSSPQPTNAQARDAPGDPALKALRLSESRYRRLFETAQDGILLLNADTAQIEDVNPYLIEMLGYSHAEFLGKKLWEVGSFADIAQSKEMFAQLQTQGYVRYKDLPLKTKAGAIVPVEFVSNAYDCEGLTVIQCNIRNISERHADREKIQRQTRLYAALSQCNYAIMHCASEEDLFLEICRAAVRTGGVKMAWVGLIDAETRMVRPVASVGDETGYLKSVNISVDADSPFGPSPTGTAIGRDEPSWCQDFLNDPMTVTWHERAARAGLAASASLPLHRNGGVVGAFTLYASEVNAFDESARALLVEMTANISFALDNFAGEFRRQQAEEEIVFKNTILQTQQETLLDAMLVLDENQGILSFNQHFIDLWPLPPHLLIARLDAPVLQAVADQTANPAAFLERIDYLKHHRDETSREEVALKDGRIIDRYCAPAVGADGKYYGRVWYFRDITERKKAEQKFKDLLEAAPDAMVIVNQDAVILLLNAQAVHLFGWRREDLLGQKVDILVPKLLCRKHPEKRNTFFENPRARPMGAGLELFGLRKDGTEFPVEISLSPLDTAEGTLVIAAIRDITERKHGERLVRDSEKRFRAIFDQAPIATALLDRQGRPIISNSHLSKMVGYSNDELSKMTFADFTYPEDVDKDLNQFDELIEGKISAYNMEKRYVHKNGSLIWANLFVTLLRGEHGLPQDVIGMAEDITERKRSEISIKRLNRVYAVLSSINSLIVRVRDPDELFREACRIAVDAGGFRMSLIAMVDQRTMRTVPVASAGKDAALLSAVHGLLSSSEIAPNSMVARATREKTAVVANDSIGDPQVLLGDQYADAGVRSMAVLPLIVSEQAVGVLALYASERDFFLEDEMKLLTELTGDIAFAIDYIDKQERLEYLAYYDALTGLANRRLFLERVAQYMRSAVGDGHRLGLFLIDLERFKNINDSLGQPAGDALLRQVAEWLTRNVGDENLLARIGADHFAVVMPEIRQGADMALLLEKMIAAFLVQPFRLNDAVFRIAAKIGVALFPDDGADADTLFRNAEAALKKAKASGERYLCYTQKMTEAVAGKLNLENQMRQALDNGEFVLHYQPKVNLVSGKITGAEALIRWNDPRSGLVPPGRFIPVLEETGLIYDVGRWALRQAIEDYLRWRAAGLVVVRIAVNVSPLQLSNRDFIAEIEQAISIDEHAAGGLELEITESLIMADVKHSIASLQTIRALGVNIAIDDFGTGFSSLSYLARLPVDTLKIDRSFVLDMTDGPEGLSLVSTIISLAHALKLKVVAEGVETAEQARLLRLLNCDEMQGYLSSKPLPGDIFEARFLAPRPAGS